MSDLFFFQAVLVILKVSSRETSLSSLPRLYTDSLTGQTSNTWTCPIHITKSSIMAFHGCSGHEYMENWHGTELSSKMLVQEIE